MSIAKFKKLRNDWQSDRSLQKRIEAAFDVIGFTEEYVDLVTSTGYQSSLPRKSKQIKDNQWGMIEFDWSAMRLIDSPLLQRLRYIKQLGFSYLTYPSAEHSRFSHSLGVGHVVTNFIRAIDRRAQETPTSQNAGTSYVKIDSIPDLSSRDLIHAALLHDVGHMPFSHVAEKVVSSQPSRFTCGPEPIESFLFHVNTTLSKGLAFSEILSLLIILSVRFERFYCDFACVDQSNPEYRLLTICNLIAGLPPTPRLTGISELISGAVDADKVDYVNRDARNCGIPVGVDVARIFLRSGVILASKDQIKALGLKDRPTQDEYLFVINSSGLDTIDEILQARTSLYQRVYFHAVTRTAERLLGKALEANIRSDRRKTGLRDALTLWSHRDVTLLEKLSLSKTKETKRYASPTQARQLPKKAYSFSPGLGNLHIPLTDILPRATDASIKEIKKQVSNTTVEANLREEQLWKGLGVNIEDRIREEAERIIRALRATKDRRLKKQLLRTGLDFILIVGCAHENQIRHNPIICQNDRLLTVRDYTNSREQQDAFELFKEVGFILCNQESRSVIFFASRIVLAQMFNDALQLEIRFGADDDDAAPPENISFVARFLPDYDTAVLRSGIETANLSRVEDGLHEVGYLADRPWVGRPMPSDDSDVQEIAELLKLFDGYRSWRVTASSVAAFLSQFPLNLRSAMALELKQITVLDAQTVVSKLRPLLTAFQQDVDIVPFSSKSGALVQNWLRKELREAKQLKFASDLRAALRRSKTGPLVFVDDNVASAVQARAQFLALLSIPRDQWPEECKEERDLFSPLRPDELVQLRARDVYLYVCVGMSAADATIGRCLRLHGFHSFKGLKYREEFSEHAWPDDLARYLKGVGRELVAWSEYRRSFDELDAEQKTKCRRNSMGYHNAGGLITTTLSVPTATVTALWTPGLYRGQPWMPLLLRTNKLKHLVVG